VKGVEWLYENYIASKGCILADDMGLGKTVQISVLITTLIRTQDLRDTVIVAPPTLLDYWETEFRKWEPKGMITMIIKQTSYKDVFLSDKLTRFKNISKVLIISNNVFNELKSQLSILIQCDLLILDEGHKAKNIETNLRKAVKEFKVKH
jgi:SNF2 family DNA or RNA helicase